MISTDPIIDIANLALNLEKLKAGQWAENIANSHIRDTHKVVNFDKLLNVLSNSFEAGSAGRLSRQIGMTRSNDAFVSTVSGSVNLDEAIATMGQSSGRYKVIAESISRKLGLMSIAARGS